MTVTASANMSPVKVGAEPPKAESTTVALISTADEAPVSAFTVPILQSSISSKEKIAKDPNVGTYCPFLSQGTDEGDGVNFTMVWCRNTTP